LLHTSSTPINTEIMANPESAGIMSGAFFVSKNEILKWYNDFFKAGITKIEETATGALHCQVLDSIFPGKVPLGKVNFNAKTEPEYIQNFKVLQDVFTKQEIKKYVDVDKLVKAKHQDNLEFCQWIKNFWDSKYNGEPYDAVARREQAIKAYKAGRGGAGASKGKGPGLQKPTAIGVKKPATSPPAAAPVAASAKVAPKPKPSADDAASKPVARSATSKPAAAPKKVASGDDDSAKVAELNRQLTKLRLTIEGLEKERNFYFGKLREIEVLCQTNEDQDAATKQKILEVLYATDENEDFEAPAADADAAAEPLGASADDAPLEQPLDEVQEDAPAEETFEDTEQSY